MVDGAVGGVPGDGFGDAMMWVMVDGAAGGVPGDGGGDAQELNGL